MTDNTGPATRVDARSDLVDHLRAELIGPAGGGEERISQRPTSRYLIGRLAPAGTTVDEMEDDGAGVAGADGDDADVGDLSPISMAMNPSSIGLSFIVADACGPITVTARWGTYSRLEPGVDDAEAPVEQEGVGEEGAQTGPPAVAAPAGPPEAPRRSAWGRVEYSESMTFDPSVGTPQRRDLTGDGVFLEFLLRARSEGGVAISAFLVNRREVPAGERIPDDSLWLFQPEISARCESGRAVFGARGIELVDDEAEAELLSNELLYWDRPEFAVGHGCAADWDAVEGDRLATEVRTAMVPSWELARIDPREDVPSELRMLELGGVGAAGVPGAKLREMLMPLADAYAEWIEGELVAKSLPAVADRLRATAETHIDRCRITHSRMVEGIELICSGPEEVREAFCFANRAMALQRQRSEIALGRRQGRTVEPREPKWRPFQIAFVLINLPGMADRRHSDREVADLLWFPTGGGKTEAYLGLAAFALAHRRLRQALPGQRSDAGVSVLMRYTLRLLTIQQFQRATTLVCACEHLRREEGAWGSVPFSIGLWVGRAATPNRYSDERLNNPGAKQVLQAMAGLSPMEKAPAGKGSPIQLLNCPWCGTELRVHQGRSDYQLDDECEMVRIHCFDEECAFGVHSDGIPAHTVDQQVYRHVPSLVIATVDKFAQMPFNGRIQSLFGRVSHYCERHGFLSDGEGGDHTAQRHNATPGHPTVTVVPTDPLEPPDLIIQDELHLISGPLGTLVGAYETAVDYLASSSVDEDLIPPKIVASTATIRRAHKQVGALFDRRVQIFPPSGVKSTDSWFGREVPIDSDHPGRLYLGIYAPGKSVKTALVRVYASLLARAQALLLAEPDVADPYMTLVGYFNSLRELGGALRLVEDDIPGRMKVLWRRDPDEWPRRYLNTREELTSNKKAEEVPRILGMLERVFTGEPPEPGNYPVDTLLASNMISVGVDVDRLGLMVVNGQPKTTAEYIQATSRVGRQSPGLVVTVYNWTRPRDTSHYERFRSYHGSLYRFVEASSVTPFSSRSRDKALEGVLASMVRLGDRGMTAEQNAGQLDRHEASVSAVIDVITGRAARVAYLSGENGEAVGAVTRDEILQDLDNWERAQSDGKNLSWTRAGMGPIKRDQPPPADKRFLVQSQEDDAEPSGTFNAPGSLREVEGEIHVYLENLSHDLDERVEVDGGPS